MVAPYKLQGVHTQSNDYRPITYGCLQSYSQIDRVSVLSEALPYLQRFRGKTIVVKYGGAAMKDPTLKVIADNFYCLMNVARDLAVTLASAL